MTDFMPQLSDGHRRLEVSVGTWAQMSPDGESWARFFEGRTTRG